MEFILFPKENPIKLYESINNISRHAKTKKEVSKLDKELPINVNQPPLANQHFLQPSGKASTFHRKNLISCNLPCTLDLPRTTSKEVEA